MRIGCLGAARIAPPALIHPAKVRGGAALQAVAARDPARAEAFAHEHGFTRVAASYAELVDADDIDLIYNPLPINLHAEWSIRALQAGKHVLCEKPFAMNAAEARAVQDAALAAGKRVIEAFHYRYHPGWAQCLDWVRSGEIGAVQEIVASFNVPIADKDGTEIRHLPHTGGGAFMDLGCYPLSWALSVTGEAPAAVESRAALTSRGVDESMEAHLTFPGGVRASLACSMALDASFTASVTISGSGGEIRFFNPLNPFWGANLSLKGRSGEKTARVSRVATYLYQLDAVLDALDTGDPLPTEGEAILRQQQTIDRIYEAAGLGGLRHNPPR